MLALSIKQPWADALVQGHKTIEIRGWRPSVSAIGQIIAIHAGREPDRRAPLFVVRLASGSGQATTVARERSGGIVGVARLTGLVTYATYAEWLRDEAQHLNTREWFEIGLIGWRFDRQVAFARLIPCRGRLGIFDLPPQVEAEVRNQMAVRGIT
jgi:hypothetical protein